MFLGIIIVVLFVLFAFTCYKKAPPTAAIVVTGFGLKKPKVVCGKGTFVIPVLQRADKLNMRLLKIDVKTPETGVKTKEGVSLWIDSVVTIQVYSDNSTVLDSEVQASGAKDVKEYITGRQQSAISNFLGMDEKGINDKVNDVLQGNLREIVSDMTVDQILTNRKQMALSVIENARPDLAKMGLEVVTFNVQDVKDAVDAQGHNHGVIEAIGIEQEEAVKKRAEIARAEAARDIARAKADAEMAANEKEVEAQTAIAQRNNELQLAKAKLKAEADKAAADANAAGQIQTNLRAKEIKEAEADAFRTNVFLTCVYNDETREGAYGIVVDMGDKRIIHGMCGHTSDEWEYGFAGAIEAMRICTENNVKEIMFVVLDPLCEILQQNADGLRWGYSYTRSQFTKAIDVLKREAAIGFIPEHVESEFQDLAETIAKTLVFPVND